MKKAKGGSADTLRREYKRSDFGTLVRGKYVSRLEKSSNVIVLDPDVAKLFPNSAAVNAALYSLAVVAKRSARVTLRPTATRKRRARISAD